MNRIKIISNPYQKEILYQRWNASSEQWITIDLTNNENSRLLSEELTNVFFPFVVEKIVDEIIKEYRDASGKIEIVFEGTDDEYKDLQEVCACEKYTGKIVLSKSDKYLENARDILPDITKIFESIKPLITLSFTNIDKVAGELKRFTDASEDKIPICIVGNYSSGKSTFINALIGCEILPSGDEPITAKIYKIERSPRYDRGYIEFGYEDQEVKLRFEEFNYRFTSGMSDKPLIQKLDNALSEIRTAEFPIRFNRALEIINSFENGDNEDCVSDLISITIPFVEGIWGQTSAKFVIFDTPGSNSASNDKHFKVLKKAMEGFSNGLPIYISEFDSLDSTDNEKLYQEIRGMKELDDRFTMIIVNKADVARLPKGEHSKEDEERILSLAIPKNLYSEGIFFVSSIMGLGSKNRGKFIDQHYAEVYEDQEQKYSDTSSRFYKTLYKYNIMPEQLKQRSVEMSRNNEQKIYANSGLYAVEQEIQTFAGKYSPYNKCWQSHLFLSRVIQLTSREIETVRKDKEEFKQRISEKLDSDKKELVNKIETKGNDLESEFINAYGAYMVPFVEDVQPVQTVEGIKKLEELFILQQESNQDVAGYKANAKDSISALYDNLKENLSKAIKTPSMSALKEIGTDWMSDVKMAVERDNELKETQKTAYNNAADELIQKIIEDFTSHSKGAKIKLETESRRYWAERTAQIKDELVAVVTESSMLTNEQKSELTVIILDYKDIVFESAADDIFTRENFEKGIRFGKWVIGKSDRLNIEKLTKQYNSEIESEIENIFENIRISHEQSLKVWEENLIQLILENIVEYNPTLHNQAELIKDASAKIEELEKRQLQLNRYTEDIRSMMDWK